MDEFENLSEDQQRHIKTLLRVRKDPVSFRIGGRLYSVRSHRTTSANEENKEDSEFKVLRLDAMMRLNKSSYEDFARRLVARRLAHFKDFANLESNPKAVYKKISECFQTQPKSRFGEVETEFVRSKYPRSVDRPYFKRLLENLGRLSKMSMPLGVKSLEDAREIASKLSIPQLPLLEKINILLLYQEWAGSRNLLSSADSINRQCISYQANPRRKTSYAYAFDHFGSDLLAQALRECDQKQRYVGLDAFIAMSCGILRNLLVLLRNVYDWATFNGEHPFVHGQISLRAQSEGVRQSTEWFL